MSTKQLIFWGVIRVSEKGDREDARFHSPGEQRSSMEAYVEREGGRLVGCVEEIDVKGRSPLAKRPGLREGIEAIEAGEANVLLVAYMDRLVRSHALKEEIVDRVEKAGGQVMTLDAGAISHKTAAQRLSSGVLSLINEYYVEQTREKVANSQKRAIEEGRHIGTVPFGYKQEGGMLVLDPEWDHVVRSAFRKAADGPHAALDYLRQACPHRRWELTRVRNLLENRVYLGEVKYAGWSKPDAHPPLVTRAEWEAAQHGRGPRRRDRCYPLSGFASCASCGHHLIGASLGSGRRGYRCGNPECSARASILAGRLEEYCREVLIANWDGICKKGSSASLGKLQQEADDAVAERVAYIEHASALDKASFNRGLAARDRRVSETQAALRDASKDRLAKVDIEAIIRKVGGEDLAHALSAAFAEISVATVGNRKGRGFDVAERVRILEHDSDIPVVLPDKAYEDALQAAA